MKVEQLKADGGTLAKHLASNPVLPPSRGANDHLPGFCFPDYKKKMYHFPQSVVVTVQIRHLS